VGEFCVVHGAYLFVASNDVQAGLELQQFQWWQQQQQQW
jgi:hypothetical protein